MSLTQVQTNVLIVHINSEIDLMDTPELLNPANDNTRQRILEAAGEVFAEFGFHRATIKQITDRARANIAAVNYHFGDKERLYLEVLRYSHGCALAKYPPNMGLPPNAPADQRLHAFIHSFLMRILDEGRPAWHGKLMSREMAEPSAALGVIVDEHIRPAFGFLAGTLRELLGGSIPDQEVHLWAASTVGQCIFYHFGRPVMQRLNFDLRFVPSDVARIAPHITQVMLAALKDRREALRAGVKP